MNKYFFIKDNQTIIKLNIEDYNYFARQAVNLEPVQSVTESDSYVVALQNYFINNESNSIAAQRFAQLIASENSKAFFKTCIELNLLENKFRNKGLEEADIPTYNHIKNKYQLQLKTNYQQFEELDTQKKL